MLAFYKLEGSVATGIILFLWDYGAIFEYVGFCNSAVIVYFKKCRYQ